MAAARIRVFETRELLAKQLEQEIQEGDWVLVKGSRATGMERSRLLPAAAGSRQPHNHAVTGLREHAVLSVISATCIFQLF